MPQALVLEEKGKLSLREINLNMPFALLHTWENWSICR